VTGEGVKIGQKYRDVLYGRPLSLLLYWYETVSGGANSLPMAERRQVISRISKGSQKILIFNFIIITFDCQDGSQGGVFMTGHLPWHALV